VDDQLGCAWNALKRISTKRKGRRGKPTEREAVLGKLELKARFETRGKRDNKPHGRR
jgi:hypothetical protein